MALPVLQTPKYSTTIPSSGKVVEFRPFLVKEEKVLLIAQESDDPSSTVNAISDVITACTFEKVDVNKLTSYDLEFLFLQLRSKSVGEIVDLQIKCSSCNKDNPVKINLDKVEVKYPEKKIDNKIQLTDEVGVIMKPISAADVGRLSLLTGDEVKLMNETICASLESIYDKNNVYTTAETPAEELVTFIDSLSRAQMAKIEEYISSSPKLAHTIEFKCSSCGEDNKLEVEGAQSFFG